MFMRVVGSGLGLFVYAFAPLPQPGYGRIELVYAPTFDVSVRSQTVVQSPSRVCSDLTRVFARPSILTPWRAFFASATAALAANDAEFVAFLQNELGAASPPARDALPGLRARVATWVETFGPAGKDTDEVLMEATLDLPPDVQWALPWFTVPERLMAVIPPVSA